MFDACRVRGTSVFKPKSYGAGLFKCPESERMRDNNDP